MTAEEAALVLAKINAHHGNAPATDLQLQCFVEELAGFVTLPLAMEAVRVFYSENTTGRWMGSGDVNAYARRLRAAALPSDADIERMADERGLASGAERWQFRRSLLKACGGGLPVADALVVAERQAVRPLLPRARPSIAGRKPDKGASDGVSESDADLDTGKA